MAPCVPASQRTSDVALLAVCCWTVPIINSTISTATTTKPVLCIPYIMHHNTHHTKLGSLYATMLHIVHSHSMLYLTCFAMLDMLCHTTHAMSYYSCYAILHMQCHTRHAMPYYTCNVILDMLCHMPCHVVHNITQYHRLQTFQW